MSDSDEAPLLSQQQTIHQQDQALDDLATIIRRQRDIGITIGNEVDDQNGKFTFKLYFLKPLQLLSTISRT